MAVHLYMYTCVYTCHIRMQISFFIYKLIFIILFKEKFTNRQECIFLCKITNLVENNKAQSLKLEITTAYIYLFDILIVQCLMV